MMAIQCFFFGDLKYLESQMKRYKVKELILENVERCHSENE